MGFGQQLGETNFGENENIFQSVNWNKIVRYFDWVSEPNIVVIERLWSNAAKFADLSKSVWL